MHRRILIAAVAALLMAPLLPGLSSAQTSARIEVEVERAEPEKEKLPTLRFFRENPGLLAARLDGLQETAVTTGQETAVTTGQETSVLDERLLRYQEMVAASRAAQDTLDSEQAMREKQALLSRVTELGELEAHLDLLGEILARQESRLEVLEADFLGDQPTAMIVIVQGHAADRQPEMIRIRDGFDEMTDVVLRSEQLLSLEKGGLVQVYHAFIEPREQTWEIALDGGNWDRPFTAYLTFNPQRNRLNYLMVDLTEVDPRAEGAGLTATAWYHDPSRLLSEGGQD